MTEKYLGRTKVIRHNQVTLRQPVPTLLDLKEGDNVAFFMDTDDPDKIIIRKAIVDEYHS